VYRKRQDAEFVSDFDRVIAETKRLVSGNRKKLAASAKTRPRKR
jgi:hypothetical protein